MFRLLAATIAAAAVTAPAAVAMHAPGAVAPTRPATASASTADQLDARLGPKYVVAPQATTSPVSTVSARDTRRWIYPIVLVALIAGLVALRVRRNGRPNVAAAIPSRHR